MNILSIDAWGNQDDGFEWNAWYKVGTISLVEFEALDTDAKRVEYMCDEGYLRDAARRPGCVEVEYDQYNVVFCDGDTGQPLFAIEYGNCY